VKQKTNKKLRREIFVLTPEEKRTVCFVLIAFLLGLATKHYRAKPSPASPTTEVTSSIAASPNPAQKRAKKERPERPK
jgi:hypothetical protein